MFFFSESEKVESHQSHQIERSYSRKQSIVFRFWIYEGESLSADEK